MRLKPDVIIVGMGAEVHAQALSIPILNTGIVDLNFPINQNPNPALRRISFVWKKKDGTWWFCEGEKPMCKNHKDDKIVYLHAIRNPWLCTYNGQQVTVEVKPTGVYII